jgi:hypothetical protein
MRKFIVVLLMFGIFVTAGISKTKSTKSKSKSACKKTAFDPGCSLPFDAIKQEGLAIDKTCGQPGCADPNDPKQMAQATQNAAKNNFCATGAPVTVTPNMLAQLMAVAQAKGVTFGNESQVPADRNVLKGFTIGGVTLGEGTVVRMAAFVIEAHYADVSSGESVNCKIGSSAVGAAKAQAANDIHIALGSQYGADECGSVTAEMSPHFRPAAWKVIAGIKTKDKATKPLALSQYPVRITGQLFFDASHKLCAAGVPTSGNPARQSLWEIHPVYTADVCSNKTLSGCKVDDDSVWTPLDKWTAPAN